MVALDPVRFARKLQIGSSSPKLVAITPGGTRALKRTNPFDGGLGNLDEICERRGRAADPLRDLAHTGNEMPTMERFASNGQVFP